MKSQELANDKDEMTTLDMNVASSPLSFTPEFRDSGLEEARLLARGLPHLGDIFRRESPEEARVAEIENIVEDLVAGRAPGPASYTREDGSAGNLPQDIENRWVTAAYLRREMGGIEYEIGGSENPVPFELAVLNPDLIGSAMSTFEHSGEGPFLQARNGELIPISSNNPQAVSNWAADQLGLERPTDIRSNDQIRADVASRRDQRHGGNVTAYEIARAAIAAGWEGNDLNKIVAIALAESHSYPGMAFQNNTSNGFEGAIQIHRASHTNKIGPSDDPGDLFDNLRIAHAIMVEAANQYGHGGRFLPWPNTRHSATASQFSTPANAAVQQALDDVDEFNSYQSNVRVLRENAKL